MAYFDFERKESERRMSVTQEMNRAKAARAIASGNRVAFAYLNLLGVSRGVGE